MEAEIASIFNVSSFAVTSSPVQESVEIENNEDDDDGINYSPNPDTSIRDEPVVTLPTQSKATTAAGAAEASQAPRRKLSHTVSN